MKQGYYTHRRHRQRCVGIAADRSGGDMVFRSKSTYALVTLLLVVAAMLLFADPASAQGLSIYNQGRATVDTGDLLPYTGGMSLTSLVALIAGLALLGVGAAVAVWQFRSSRREDSDE